MAGLAVCRLLSSESTCSNRWWVCLHLCCSWHSSFPILLPAQKAGLGLDLPSPLKVSSCVLYLLASFLQTPVVSLQAPGLSLQALAAPPLTPVAPLQTPVVPLQTPVVSLGHLWRLCRHLWGLCGLQLHLCRPQVRPCRHQLHLCRHQATSCSSADPWSASAGTRSASVGTSCICASTRPVSAGADVSAPAVDNHSTWGCAAIDASCSFMAPNWACWSALMFIALQLCLSMSMSGEPSTPLPAASMIRRPTIVDRCSIPVF